MSDTSSVTSLGKGTVVAEPIGSVKSVRKGLGVSKKGAKRPAGTGDTASLISAQTTSFSKAGKSMALAKKI